MNALIEILKQVRPESDFEHSSDYLAEGLLDSFDIVALVAALDRHYNISIDGVEIIPDNFNSLTAIQKLLAAYGVQT